MDTELSLSGEEIKRLVNIKLETYDNLSLLEQYAMFMGKAQILEFALKGLLTRKYGIPSESMEKWALGSVKNKLKESGLRQDFITLLNRVVKHRNYIAHDFLVNIAITTSFVNFSDRKLYGDLFHATHEIEQIFVLYDWIEEHNGWD